MGQARRAVVAGTFYPAKADELAATVDAALAAASLGQSVAGLAGVIVPHAGYVYSAPVAATAYARLVGLRGRIHRVAILGPSHFVPLDGLAVPTVASFLTPLGAAPVAGDACARLVDGELAAYSDPPHASEHSIEVQLPFLQRILDQDTTYVPVAVGRCEPAAVADALDVLDADLVVVSTDLSHYRRHEAAQRQDRRTAASIVERQLDQIGPDDACGRHPLRGLLAWCLRHDHRVELVDLRTSADTAGRPDRVVGYGAFVVTAPRP